MDRRHHFCFLPEFSIDDDMTVMVVVFFVVIVHKVRHAHGKQIFIFSVIRLFSNNFSFIIYQYISMMMMKLIDQ